MACLRGLRHGPRRRCLRPRRRLSALGAAATAAELAERAVGAAISLGRADVALGVGVLRIGELAAAAIPGPPASRSKAGAVIHDCPERTTELGDCAHRSDDTACGGQRPRAADTVRTARAGSDCSARALWWSSGRA